MQRVFDSTGACNVSTLKRLNVIGIIRYVAGGGDWKHIHRAEADAYRKNGIAIGYCYEAGAGWMLNDDGGSAVRSALSEIKSLGGPSDCFVWLACDTDTSTYSSLERCMASAAKAHPRGKAGVGIYGGYNVTRHFGKLGYKTWQTVAWSGGQHDKDAALYQHAGAPLGSLGFDYDLNDVLDADWGQENAKPATPPVHVPDPPQVYVGKATIDAKDIDVTNMTGGTFRHKLYRGEVVDIGDKNAHGLYPIRWHGGRPDEVAGWAPGDHLKRVTA